MNRASVLNDLAEYAGTCDDEAATLIPIRPRHFAQRDQVIAVHAERVCGILVVALILVLARGLFLCDVAVGLLRVVVSCIRRDQQWFIGQFHARRGQVAGDGHARAVRGKRDHVRRELCRIKFFAIAKVHHEAKIQRIAVASER